MPGSASVYGLHCPLKFRNSQSSAARYPYLSSGTAVRIDSQVPRCNILPLSRLCLRLKVVNLHPPPTLRLFPPSHHRVPSNLYRGCVAHRTRRDLQDTHLGCTNKRHTLPYRRYPGKRRPIHTTSPLPNFLRLVGHIMARRWHPSGPADSLQTGPDSRSLRPYHSRARHGSLPPKHSPDKAIHKVSKDTSRASKDIHSRVSKDIHSRASKDHRKDFRRSLSLSLRRPRALGSTCSSSRCQWARFCIPAMRWLWGHPSWEPAECPRDGQAVVSLVCRPATLAREAVRLLHRPCPILCHPAVSRKALTSSTSSRKRTGVRFPS